MNNTAPHTAALETDARASIAGFGCTFASSYLASAYFYFYAFLSAGGL
jgi:hypothetical protein